MLQRGHVLVVVSGYATAGPFAYSIAKPNSVAPATIIAASTVAIPGSILYLCFFTKCSSIISNLIPISSNISFVVNLLGSGLFFSFILYL